eukprot:GFUD01052512.1.p1 GENE.GFUD01052512.1~~GFUD01052512.1.p1  ORF type:complete len:589 (+),score=160.31 GFUD01052512.1:151-1917(+)
MWGHPMPVKEERADDAEINDLARKIAEANRQKLAQSQQLTQQALNGPVALARPGQPGIQQYFSNMSNGNGPAAVNGKTAEAAGKTVDMNGKPAATDKPVDEESKKGRFGWFDIEKVFLPLIFRYGTEKYTSVRMVERKLLNRFLQVLPPEVNSCTCIRSYYITDAESKLLNEINLKHTDCTFGKEAFTSKDLVVRLKDAREFHKFLDLCHKKLVLKKSNASDRCGFFRINGESVVPYTVKEGVKYVPLFYFEGETDHLKLKSESVEGWDLAYLKFCCKVQGIRNELFANDTCKVVALDEIKGHFPAGTTFEDYWPAKGSIEPVPSSRHGVSAGNWTQKPAGQPSAKPIQSAVQMQPNGLQNLNQLSALNAAYRLPQQLTAAQLQQLSLQGLQGSQMTGQQLQQLIRAGLVAGQQQPGQVRQQQPGAYRQQQAVDMAALQRQQQRQAPAAANKAFPGKLTQIKEFPMEKSNQPPYKLQKALIDQKIVPCINVRPYVFHDLMMTLPDFVKHFFPDLPLEKSREMLQEILKVVLYKGNTGHQEILRQEGKCQLYDPVPLVLVKDIMTYMPQIKYMFSSITSEPANKRPRVN